MKVVAGAHCGASSRVRLEAMPSTFGERLKQARERMGMSQEALGAAAGVRLGTIWRYEKDSQEPKLGTIRDLANALECEVGWLVGGDDDDLDNEYSALNAFLETRLGATATPDERASLRSFRAFTGVPTVDTYHSMLLAIRGTVEADADVVARAESKGAIKVGRKR